MELIIPIVGILLLVPGMQIRNVDDFSRFSKNLGQQISLVDGDGIVREGRLAAASADAITMTFAGSEKSFSKAEVVSAERLRDGSVDGAIKGAIFGAVVGLFAYTEGTYTNQSAATGTLLASVAIYSSIGWVLDATQTNREPIYGAAGRAASKPKPALKFSFRF